MAKSEAYNMDCLEYMRTLPDNAFDLAVVDPPYGINIGKSVGGGGSHSERKIIVGAKGATSPKSTTRSMTQVFPAEAILPSLSGCQKIG